MLVVFENCLCVVYLFLELFLDFILLFLRAFTRLGQLLFLFSFKCGLELSDILGEFNLLGFEFGDGLALFLQALFEALGLLGD